MVHEKPGEILPAQPRTRVQATLPDGRVFEAPLGTAVGDVLSAAFGGPKRPFMAAIVDGRLRELTYTLDADASVTPLDATTTDGVRVYRRSLAFLMLVAFDEVFPGSEVFIEHSATTAAGYYCEARGRSQFTADELRAVERRMRGIVTENAPITRERVSRQEAIGV